jgi:hypothetical protein
MEVNVDKGRPGGTSIAAHEPAQLWVLDPATDDRGSRPWPLTRPYSFAAECECPDDCLRDHANE